jgi:hypothetical protein
LRGRLVVVDLVDDDRDVRHQPPPAEEEDGHIKEKSPMASQMLAGPMLVIMSSRRVLPFCKMMAGPCKKDVARYCGAQSIGPDFSIVATVLLLDHQPPASDFMLKIFCWEGSYQLSGSTLVALLQ